MLTHVQKVRKLYKTILKLHRALPPDLRVLGNDYAREEFRRHKKCTPQQSAIFMQEWSNYVLTLAEQIGVLHPERLKPLGMQLTDTDLDKFQDQQLQQLYELLLATKSNKS